MSVNLFSFRSASEVLGKSLDIDDIESLKEICRICDKKKEVECPRCFVFNQLHQRNASCIHNNTVIADEDVNHILEENRSDNQNQPSKKFFSEMSTEPLGRCQPVDTSYINFAQDDVNHNLGKSGLFTEYNGDGKTLSNPIKIPEKPRLTSTRKRQLPEGKHARITKQDTLTLYSIAEDLDERDCQILYYLDKGSHQSEVAKILGLTRQAVNKRVKRLEKLGILVRKAVYPVKYLVNSDFIKLIRSKLFGINKVDRSDDGGSLGGVEHPEPDSPSRPSRPSPPSLDVHHVSIKVPYSVNLPVSSDSACRSDVNRDVSGNVSSDNVNLEDINLDDNLDVNLDVNRPLAHQPRFACATCPKFRERYHYAKKCSCRRGRFTKMNNWTYFSIRYNGYEISSNPSTIVIKGIRVSGLRKEAILAEALMKAQKILNEYFEKRYYSQTGELVTLHWDRWQLAGKMHITLNHELSNLVQQHFGGTVSIKVDDDIIQFDSSPDDDGSPQNHIEVHTSSPEPIDYLARLITGDYDHKLSSIEQTISKLATVASGGYSSQTIADIIKSGMRSLESRISRIESEFESLKNLVTNMREELQQLILEGNGKHIREINMALQTMAALWLRMDSLESKLQEFRSAFDVSKVPDPGGGSH